MTRISPGRGPGVSVVRRPDRCDDGGVVPRPTLVVVSSDRAVRSGLADELTNRYHVAYDVVACSGRDDTIFADGFDGPPT